MNFKSLYIAFINSHFYHNVYYKHTKQHKKDLTDIKKRVLAIRNKALPKGVK